MTEETVNPLVLLHHEATALAVSTLGTIDAHQRMTNGSAENGNVNLNIPAILLALSYVTARIIDVVEDDETRMKYAAYFDDCVLVSSHNNEKARQERAKNNQS